MRTETRATVRACSTLLCLALNGCSLRAYIELEVSSEELVVGRDVDILVLSLSEPGHEALLIDHREYSLDGLGHDFPVTILLEPDREIPHDLEAEVSATLNGELKGWAASTFTWNANQVNHVRLPLLIQ